ncbi:MAG: DUF4160 domain-containing protein [Caldilineaceae bacterium]|nr:DUF4160 domain-containing protein [Caldilineaceae bacterium]MBP8121753.1 DUF4160 domain-containing protein [Caldilineaceae bacterium]MBP9071457.1 DUF4160 domain-containing protein [Caldilineaceae bacterium]
MPLRKKPRRTPIPDPHLNKFSHAAILVKQLSTHPLAKGRTMPVILRERGFEFSFVMFDLGEPMHVHVRNGRNQAKFWIDPLGMAWNRGFRPHELNSIERIIRDNEEFIRDVWQQESAKR